MITFYVSTPNEQAYKDYELMYLKAKGSTKGCLNKDTFISRLRKGQIVKLPNAEFKVETPYTA